MERFGRQRHRHNAGRYNCSITIRAQNLEAGTTDHQPKWAGGAIVELHGYWRQLSQRETVVEGGNYSGATGVWEIPWIPNLTTSYRVEFGTRLYRIIGIANPEERNRELHLFCVEDEGGKGAGE